MSKVIRILHVIGIMNRGGAETMIMNLYRNVDRTKVQFDFVENTSEKAIFDDEKLALGGRIYNCPHYNGKNHFEYKKWWNDFFKEHKGEYKIIHGHLGSTASIYLKIAKKYGLCTIAHSHNTIMKKDLNNLIYKVYSYPTRFIADYFFTCSYVAGVSRFGKKIANDSNRCYLLKNSVETKKFLYDKDVRDQVRKEFDVQDKIVIGHVGRFNVQKNHVFLIDIFKKIYEKNKNTVLFLLGDGEEKEKILEKVKNLDLVDCVRFLGVRNDVNKIMQCMDVMLFPSLFEGLPVTIIEAQASSLPCVLSDTITKECKIIENVEFLSLKTDVDTWSNVTLKMSKLPRYDSSNDIIKSGYDIEQNAIWLQNFYILKTIKGNDE